MFDFDSANLPITKEWILEKISDEDIFKRYCTNYNGDMNSSFKSDFYRDNNPSCRMYINQNQQLCYKDFGTGEHYDCFSYVMKKYNVTFTEALNIITNDFNLRKIKIDVDFRALISNDLLVNSPKSPLYVHNKSDIQVVYRGYNEVDIKYWGQYAITPVILLEYNVFACKEVYLIKDNQVKLNYTYSPSNPIYAYKFENADRLSYKIYRPYADKKGKWLFNGTKNDVEGFDQLDLLGDVLILTKSMKDVMCMRVLGYNAISLQGEHNKIDEDFLNRIMKRYNKIYILYDNDESGILATKNIQKVWNIPELFIPLQSSCKDLSDYIKAFGLEEARKLINNLLNE